MNGAAVGIVGGIVAGGVVGEASYAEAQPRADWPEPQTHTRSSAAFRFGMLLGTPLLVGGGIGTVSILTAESMQVARGAFGIGLGFVAGALLGRAAGQLAAARPVPASGAR